MVSGERLLATLCVFVMTFPDEILPKRQQKIITIGGLFEYEFEQHRQALDQAVNRVNRRSDILHDVHLTHDIETIHSHDSFAASKGVCRQLRDGVAAILGPMSSTSAGHIQSICDAVDMPHIETQWNYNENQDVYSINLFPHYLSLSRAFLDFIVYHDWTIFTILYENDEGLIRLQELLKATSSKIESFYITLRRLEEIPEGSGDYRTTLKEIRSRGDSKIVLDCDWRKVHAVLKQAKSINMTIPYYHYMLTTLDIELVNLDMFSHLAVNITAFRLVDWGNPRVAQVIEEDYTDLPSNIQNGEQINKPHLTTEIALLYDAVEMFSLALDELSRARDIQTTPLSCNKPKPWEHGPSLINYMKGTQFEGLTGSVWLDDRGKRSSFSLNLVEVTKDGLKKVGTWDSGFGINITKDYLEEIEEVADSLKTKTLVVTTILEQPYMMLKKNVGKQAFEGNARFEGFCVDLLAEVSKYLHFNYTLKLVDDGKYGAPEGPKQEWNGMVRELMDKRADLAVASLTISYMREQVIDFTKPFMNLGISILFRRPERKNPGLFSFLYPLSIDIWIYMLVAYLIVSFALFVLARFSPYEWYNPHPCNPDCNVVENQFTLLNSLWFSVGSLMQQGSEVAPRAVSTRMVSGIWWFFTLILISSYTANLAAFLTVERMRSPIENADDLSKQREIKYGTLYGGSTMSFFQTSKIESYERMWKAMSDFTPSVFVNSTNEGIERVKKGDYAFLLESRMNEYITQRNCDLMQVGGLLDSKGYGIGTPRGSPYRDLISDAILRLQEEQILQMLYNKWWKEDRGGGMCDAMDDKVKKDANALTIGNVGGVFVVLAVGLMLSPFVAIIEFVWKNRREKTKTHPTTSDNRESMCSEICKEIHFAFRCSGGSTRILNRRRNFSLTPIEYGQRLSVSPPVPPPLVPAAAAARDGTYQFQPPRLINGDREKEKDPYYCI